MHRLFHNRPLEARGFIRFADRGDRRLLDPHRLLEEWVTHYHTALRTRLNPRRFEGDTDALQRADLNNYDAYWGGEVAADKLTRMLKPALFTIYAREPIARLVAAHRLRARPRGPIEVLDVFWKLPPEPDHPDVAPPPLAYADLLATRDGRGIEAAKIIYDRLIEPAVPSRMLVNSFGLPPGRATRDIDFGVAVESWEQFQALTLTLGSLLLTKLKNALFSRRRRRLVTLYCDEV